MAKFGNYMQLGGYVEKIPASEKYNLDEFDCRLHVKPGDVIQFDSYFACDQTANVSRSGPIKYRAVVLDTYEKFVRVRLKKTIECVNRWNIRSVNGHPVEQGRFSA